MLDRRAKLAILSALRHEPDLSALASLSPLNANERRALLHWLDQSGLALTFLRRLRLCDATSLIPDDLRVALEQRLARNVDRLRDMLEEFHRLTDSFHEHGVAAATLKGFTLVPDFCEDLSLRHQTDFDFLVDPGNVAAAAAAFQSCGYSTACLSESGESCFTTPLRHIPSEEDDIYSLQRHRQADLHTSIWENTPWLKLNVPTDCLQHAEPSVLHSVHFYALSLEDKFLMQVLHLFRHSFRSWIRLSWVLEIARCLQVHQRDEHLWRRVIERAGEDRLTKSIFAFVLGLANRLFGCTLPSTLLSWSSPASSRSMRTWLDHFSLDWAISDWPGSLNNLFFASEFIPDRRRRLLYLRSRLLPAKGRMSIGAIAAGDSATSWNVNAAHLRYVAGRSTTHLKSILCLPWQHLRWKALMLARTEGMEP
ncbi:MAG TPA: nucleotidyltransferase family protein [Candidatus Acidoferrum sp.]